MAFRNVMRRNAKWKAAAEEHEARQQELRDARARRIARRSAVANDLPEIAA
jgi:hypothetical protein